MEEVDGLASDGDGEEEDPYLPSSTQRQRSLAVLDSDEEGIADLLTEDKGSGEPCQHRLVFSFEDEDQECENCAEDKGIKMPKVMYSAC